MLGGENIEPTLIEAIESLSYAEIYNIYGPSETTDWSAYASINAPDITIGRPIANTQIYILDKNQNPMPIGAVGELCISGDGVGRGYLNRPELTAEKFVPNPFIEGKRMYKTGDLAKWREDGQLEYVGRMDNQVKIRGLRIELGEIENAIAKFDGVRQVAVVDKKDESGRQYICAYYIGEELDIKELRKELGKTLPQYMIPHFFTMLDTFPTTGSGKTDRRAFPAPNFTKAQTETEYVAPVTEREKALVRVFETVLGVSPIGMNDNVFELGGDSLKAIELVAKLEREGFSLTVQDVLSLQTVAAIAETVSAKSTQHYQKAVFEGDIPATPAQARIYTAQSVAPELTTYNVPLILKSAKPIDREKLLTACKRLIELHEMLRTHFDNRDGKIIQVINEIVTFALDDAETFIRPFDLSKAPLLRVKADDNLLQIDMHHIISDGGSLPIFMNELSRLYAGETLPEPAAQYKAFTADILAYRNSDKYKLDEAYWLETFNGELPVLSIATDKPRPQKRSYQGQSIFAMLGTELTQKIKTLAKNLNVTPFVCFFGGFTLLLSKYSSEEDIVVGIPVSGRESSRYMDALGMFVNTVALRNRPLPGKTAAEFLREVQANSIQAIEHQMYPYEDLVKALDIEYDASHSPLFDVMFAYQSENAISFSLDDNKLEPQPFDMKSSKYDIVFNLMPQDNDTVVMIEYCSDLWNNASIERMFENYKALLANISDGENKPLKDISALSESEYQKVIWDFNDTAVAYPKDKCIHQLFEEQAANAPDAVAVVACDATLTYNELNRQANSIAGHLLNAGIRPNDIVPFILPRTSYLISALFGILKSGGAYLPIDPSYPAERIEYMLKDCQAKVLITTAERKELSLDGKTLYIEELLDGCTDNPDVSIPYDDKILSGILSLPLAVIKNGLELLVKFGLLTVEDSVFSLVGYDDYADTKATRERKLNAKRQADYKAKHASDAVTATQKKSAKPANAESDA